MAAPPNGPGPSRTLGSAQASESATDAARLLITGANGFVGRHAMIAFAEALRSGGRVVGIGRGAMPGGAQGGEYRSIDLLDAATLTRFLMEYRPTHVLHLAGLSSVREAMTSRTQTWRTNLCGLLNLCEAMTQGEPGATFLYASSGELYGRAFLCGSPVSEETPPLPANSYAKTKRAGEQMVGDILPAAGIKAIILRPFNHIGRGQDERFVAASFAGQIARIEAGLAEPVLQVGDLSARRDFLDVDDVVAAYRLVAEQAGRLPNASVFNIASGQARPISDILDGLKALARVPFEVRIDRERLRPSEIPTSSGDASALERAVGWTARMRWEDTLAGILDDARSRVAAGSGS